jgi:L-2,4-diaminobutyrate decarboxylase
VVRVPVDGDRRLDPDALDRTLERIDAAGQQAIALVATAGTTDFGAIDPLPACASRARRRDLWLHVDAAVGGPLLLSDRHRHRLDGLAAADSVGIDFHKLLWQPVPCGAFLVRSAGALAPLDVQVEYLNAADGDDEWQLPHLVRRSLATSRRLDALSLLVTFQSVGRRRLGALLEHLLDLTRSAGALVHEQPSLRLAHAPSLVTVVFRYVPRPDDPARSDLINAAIRTRLLTTGTAVVGRTLVDDRVHLKLTLLNPAATATHLAQLVQLIAAAGDDLDGAS